MGIREDALALAYELEAFEDGDCEECSLYGQPECKGHLSCMEVMARYAARKMREAVERDERDVTTVSAYDLLNEEDRKALAWVRARGGVNALSRGFQDADNRRIELCSSLGIDLETGWADAMVAMRRRLMPEGMEWPKVDGKPVDFKTVYGPSLGVLDAVSIYNNMACEVMGHDGIIKHASEIHAVVLAADGESLEVGQAVYATHYGYAKCTVLAIEWVVDGYLVEVENEGGHKFRQTPDEFTHQRPVLDADGVEIRVGDVLYSVETGDYVTVDSIEPGNPWFAIADGALQHCAKFTHQRPVFDADGNRIEPAMDVWWVCESDERGIHAEKLHVESIGEDGFVTCSPFNGGTWVELDSTELYVHEPVLDADGVPCREGDHGWWVEQPGVEIVVKHIDPDECDQLTVCDVHGRGNTISADEFTHNNPEIDTWERIEEDKGLNPFDYCKKVEHKLFTFDNAEEYKSSDLVRRCRALVEKEDRNE